MMKQELIAALEASDVWVKDRYNHFQMSFGGNKYRLKIQPLVVRYERKHGVEWYAKFSDYYKNVTVQDGSLRIAGYRVSITSATMPKLPAA